MQDVRQLAKSFRSVTFGTTPFPQGRRTRRKLPGKPTHKGARAPRFHPAAWSSPAPTGAADTRRDYVGSCGASLRAARSPETARPPPSVPQSIAKAPLPAPARPRADRAPWRKCPRPCAANAVSRRIAAGDNQTPSVPRGSSSWACAQPCPALPEKQPQSPSRHRVFFGPIRPDTTTLLLITASPA